MGIVISGVTCVVFGDRNKERQNRKSTRSNLKDYYVRNRPRDFDKILSMYLMRITFWGNYTKLRH